MYASSQSFAPMSRLLWKEFRAQRSLWLVIFLASLVPQVLIRVMISSLQERIAGVWWAAVAGPLLFVVGSLAIVFAGEREERTSDWLQQMAVPPLWTLLAKWSFVLLSTLAMGMSLVVTALMLVWSLPAVVDGRQGLAAADSILWIVAGLFLWGSFGSLLSRRVVTAVPAMGFWWLMTMVVPLVWLPMLFGMNPGHAWHARSQQVLQALAFLFIGLADVWLGWRWCQGRYLDARVLDELSLRMTTWTNRLWGRNPVRSRIPSQAEYDDLWRREWQRLIWHERHRESYHRSLLYLGCLVGLLLAGLHVVYGNDLLPGVLPLVIAFPLTMGVLGFRHEGEGQPLRFLTNHGVGARIVWLARHAVWLPRAMWIPLVVWIVACLVEQLMVLSNVRGLSDINRPHLPLQYASWLAWTNAAAVLWFGLLSYGCGHLAALMVRRVILAVTIGVVLNIVTGLWLSLMLAWQVPLWWSAGGLAAWLYGLSWWYAPAWLAERRQICPPARLAALLVIPPILLIGAVGTWRVLEVSGSSLAIPAQSLAQSEVQGLLRPSDADEQQALERLSLQMAGINTVKDFAQSATDDAEEREQAARDRFWASNESRLRAIVAVAERERCASPRHLLKLDPSEEWSVSRGWLPYQQLLMEAGRLRTEEGRLADALDYYCVSLRLASFWATGEGYLARWEGERQQVQTLEGIIAWANAPGQTAASLRGAVGRLQSEFERFPSAYETLAAQFLQDRGMVQQVVQDGWGPAATRADRNERGWRVALSELSRFLPWERIRAERMLEHRLLRSDRAARLLADGLNHPGVNSLRRMESARALWGDDESHLWDTTFLVARAMQHDDQYFLWSLVDREVVVRQSLLAVSLLAFKHEHQQWPGSLGLLLAKDAAGMSLPARVLVDPWSGELFAYGGALRNQDGHVQWPAELLRSVGRSQLRQVFVDSSPEPVVQTRNWVGDPRELTQDDSYRLEFIDGKLHLRLPYTTPPAK